MRFDSRSTDAVVQSDLVVNNAGISNVALLRPWHKGRPAAGGAAAMLAFAAGLLVAALGAWAADESARPRADRRASRHGHCPRPADCGAVRADQSARHQRQRWAVHRPALSPAHRPAARDLV